MPLPKVIIASAGSGKTHDLVMTALSDGKMQILIVTYTEQNLLEIYERIVGTVGCVPKNIELLTWYTFLVRHCVRPYQYPFYSEARIEKAFFPSTYEQDQAIRSRRYVSRENIKAYYIVGASQVVGEFASDFSIRCDEVNDGAVIARLEQIFDMVLIDEVQDLAGYDLDLLKLLFASKLVVEVVGDCRQVTYKTNNISNRHSGYRNEKIIDFFRLLEKNKECEITFKTTSRRCVQGICDFADRLYQDLPNTTSENDGVTGHDGVFMVRQEDVAAYFETYAPQVLRWDRRTPTCSTTPVNFGEAKGRTFDRTLLYVTNPIRAYIEDDVGLTGISRAKFYVALTRAKYSTAIVFDGQLHHSFTDTGAAIWNL
jgi:DNA helicase-2/ATP-dependent DNA helicase PcrA